MILERDQILEFLDMVLSVNWGNAKDTEIFSAWMMCFWQCVAIAEAMEESKTFSDGVDDLYLLANIARLHAARVVASDFDYDAYPMEAKRRPVKTNLIGKALSERLN